MRVKIASMRSRTSVSGWRWPSARPAAGQRDVDARRPAGAVARPPSSRAVERVSMCCLSSLAQLAERAAAASAGADAERLHAAPTTAALAPEVAIAERCAASGSLAAAASSRSNCGARAMSI